MAPATATVNARTANTAAVVRRSAVTATDVPDGCAGMRVHCGGAKAPDVRAVGMHREASDVVGEMRSNMTRSEVRNTVVVRRKMRARRTPASEDFTSVICKPRMMLVAVVNSAGLGRRPQCAAIMDEVMMLAADEMRSGIVWIANEMRPVVMPIMRPVGSPMIPGPANVIIVPICSQ
jgi:hypothetical protein